MRDSITRLLSTPWWHEQLIAMSTIRSLDQSAPYCSRSGPRAKPARASHQGLRAKCRRSVIGNLDVTSASREGKDATMAQKYDTTGQNQDYAETHTYTTHLSPKGPRTACIFGIPHLQGACPTRSTHRPGSSKNKGEPELKSVQPCTLLRWEMSKVPSSMRAARATHIGSIREE